MRIAVISFTRNGAVVAKELKDYFQQKKEEVCVFCVKQYAEETGLDPLTVPLKVWTKNMFYECSVLIFIGALGIAVRSIAPFLEDKTKDPAVIVLDEKGCFVISLLSGHLGGANKLSEQIVEFLKATPVITTATDRNQKLAIDSFAKENDLCLVSREGEQDWIRSERMEKDVTAMNYAKKIAVSFLNQDPVGFQCEFPIQGKIPDEFKCSFKKEKILGVWIGRKIPQKDPFPMTLYLLPKIYYLGIGCKKGTSFEKIKNLVFLALKKNYLMPHQIKGVGTIDLKKEEPGLIDFCSYYRLPFFVFSPAQLKEQKGDFTQSSFVESVTGVSNVCERSAVLAAEKGMLLQKKMVGDGVTVAIARKDWSVSFEK